jgi:archaellum biogenesis ATPase FlaH
MMTKNSFQKNSIRKRMDATGENYLTAARNLEVIRDSPFNKFFDNGFQNGSIYLFGGSSQSGKTIAAQLIMQQYIKNTQSEVLYYHFELTTREVEKRFEVLGFTEEEQRHIHAFDNLNGTYAATVGAIEVIDTMKIDIRQSGAKLIVLDYIQLLDFFHDREQMVLFIDNLKNVAVEKQVAVVLVSQLNRGEDTSGVFDLRIPMNLSIFRTLPADVLNAADVITVTDNKVGFGGYHGIAMRMLKNRFGTTDKTTLVFDMPTL